MVYIDTKVPKAMKIIALKIIEHSNGNVMNILDVFGSWYWITIKSIDDEINQIYLKFEAFSVIFKV